MAELPTIRIELQGVDGLLATLREMQVKVKSHILRNAMDKAVRPLAKLGKEKAPRRGKVEYAKGGTYVRTGLLRKSIGTRVRMYQSTAVGVVGPRHMPTQIGGKTLDPGNYGHLVEFGHRIAVGGALPTSASGKPMKEHIITRGKRKGQLKTYTGHVRGVVPAHPFLRPAWEIGKRKAENDLSIALQESLLRLIKRSQVKALG
jgi:hypothetical protein